MTIGSGNFTITRQSLAAGISTSCSSSITVSDS
jgi:hypothetical protein